MHELLGLLAVLLGLLAEADLGYKDSEHEGHNELQAAGGLHDHDRSSEGEAGGPPHEGRSPHHSIRGQTDWQVAAAALYYGPYHLPHHSATWDTNGWMGIAQCTKKKARRRREEEERRKKKVRRRRERGAGEGQLFGFGVINQKQSGRHFAAFYH